MSIAAPPCMCWTGGPCPRHGVVPREFHDCADGSFRPGNKTYCLPCSDAEIAAIHVRREACGSEENVA